MKDAKIPWALASWLLLRDCSNTKQLPTSRSLLTALWASRALTAACSLVCISVTPAASVVDESCSSSFSFSTKACNYYQKLRKRSVWGLIWHYFLLKALYAAISLKSFHNCMETLPPSRSLSAILQQDKHSLSDFADSWFPWMYPVEYWPASLSLNHQFSFSILPVAERTLLSTMRRFFMLHELPM